MDLVTFTDHDSIDGCLEFLSIARRDGLHHGRGGVVPAARRRPRSPPRRLRHHRGAPPRPAAAARATSSTSWRCLREPASSSRSTTRCISFATSCRCALPAALDEAPASKCGTARCCAAHNALVGSLGATARRRAARSRCRRQRRAHAAPRRPHVDRRARFDRSRVPRQPSRRRRPPGGAHGWSATIAGDAYGVVAR